MIQVLAVLVFTPVFFGYKDFLKAQNCHREILLDIIYAATPKRFETTLACPRLLPLANL